MAYSIPDNVAVVIETPAGRILQTSDYKLDHTPVDGMRTTRAARRARQPRASTCCSATRPTPSVPASRRRSGRREAFRQIIPLRRGRVLVSSFASNVHRVQQAIDVAIQTERKVAIVGRSMRKNVNIARSLGYMDVPDDVIVKPQELDDVLPHKQLDVCTGSQGEPMSALTRIAYNDHPAVKVESGDTVIISAKPVPGNELRVHDAINRLSRNGAEVLHQEIAPVRSRPRLRGGDPHGDRACAPEGSDARARRVPDALGARPARARRRGSRSLDPDRRERRRHRARARGSGRPVRSTRA